jgi:1,4-dihydroxy-2-naphthoyl-CoA hydrolase
MMDGNQAQAFETGQQGTLPGELGITWDEVANGRASGRFTVRRGHMAPNGFLHAASVIALVDSACGYGCVASLPEGASGFTTIELKANYLGTAKEGERRGGQPKHRQDHGAVPLHPDGSLSPLIRALAPVGSDE